MLKKSRFESRKISLLSLSLSLHSDKNDIYYTAISKHLKNGIVQTFVQTLIEEYSPEEGYSSKFLDA